MSELHRNEAATYMATIFQSDCINAFKNMLASGKSIETIIEEGRQNEKAFEWVPQSSTHPYSALAWELMYEQVNSIHTP